MAPLTTIKNLNLTFWAITLGALLFIIIAIALAGYQAKADTQTTSLYKSLILLYSLLIVPGAYLLHDNRIKRIRLQEDLEQKLNNYRKSLIIKFALIDSGILIGTVFFLLTENKTMLAFPGILLVFLFMNYPGVSKISMELQLTPEERKTIEP